MGMNLSVNVGFYFNVKEQLKEISNTVKCCTNAQCKVNGKSSSQKFCSECGNEVKEVTSSKTKKSSSVHELLPENFGDVICSFEGLDDSIWVFNFGIEEEDKYCRSFDKYSDDKPLEIPYSEIDKKISLLKENNTEIKKIIKYMTDTYGEDSIDLKYGAFSYYC
jgi:hypothetical protein